MITRAYQNAKGKRQEVTLSAEEWDALTESSLDSILGFGDHEAAEAVEKPAKAKKPSKAKKK